MHTISFAIKTAAVMAMGLMLSILFTGQALAGPGRGHGPTPEQKLTHMTKELDLSKAQQDAILPILKSEHDELKAVHEKYKDKTGSDRQGARDEIHAIRDKYASQIEAQLTPDQVTKFREMKAKRMEHGRHGKCAKGGADKTEAAPPADQK